jgi:hypothetical protein
MDQIRYCPVCRKKIPEWFEFICPNCSFVLSRENERDYLLEQRNNYRLEQEKILSLSDEYEEFWYKPAEVKEKNGKQVSGGDSEAFFVILELLGHLVFDVIFDD